jgi:chemotaxis signal transduction protein
MMAAQTMKALTIRLEDELFAVEAGSVREILDLVPITEVPNASPFVSGLINVRGRVVPLADLRVMFGMDRPEPDQDTRIVVMEVEIDGEPTIAGILADKVHDVTDIEGASIEEAAPYRVTTPVVYYGSSITQGACASRPGTCYQNIITRRLDCDYVNLGFSGSARAEPEIAEYIAGLTMSLFVYDYDHNAPNPEHLEKTHYAGYKRFREKQPTTPIIMASKPDWDLVNDFSDPETNEKRMKIIENTYLRAKAEGDENVYFINGFTDFYPEDLRGDCTVDGCHPNDLGYHYMAKAFAKIIKDLIK